MDYIIEKIDKTNFEEWDRFLLTQKYQNPFQSSKLLKSLNDCESYKPRGILFRESKQKKIVGGGVVYTVTEKDGIFSFLTTRSVINGGPVFTDPALIPLINSELIKGVGNHSVYTEVWNAIPQNNLKEYFSKDFSYTEHLNYIIDLTQGEESLFSKLSSGTRRSIKKNFKRLEIKEVKSELEFEEFYNCLKETYARVGVPLIKSEIFKKVWKAGEGLFLVAYYEGEIIASRVVLMFGGEVYDWYAGDKNKYTYLSANASIVWFILKYGLENNYKWFNFGGAGKPNKPYGPREFKRRFNGELVNYGRYLHINSHIKYLLLKLAIQIVNIFTNLKKRNVR